VPVFWFGYIVVYVFIPPVRHVPADLGNGGKAGTRVAVFLVPIFVLGIASGSSPK